MNPKDGKFIMNTKICSTMVFLWKFPTILQKRNLFFVVINVILMDFEK